MSQEGLGSEVIELTSECPTLDGVCFDPEHITLEGTYIDQLSAYRAKRVWVGILNESFLLETEHDFRLRVDPVNTSNRYTLRCEFLTACARYAFWRLTNNQAPEAQYIIETAHIPNAETRQDDFWQAPDLKVKDPASSSLIHASLASITQHNAGLLDTLKKLIGRLKA